MFLKTQTDRDGDIPSIPSKEYFDMMRSRAFKHLMEFLRCDLVDMKNMLCNPENLDHSFDLVLKGRIASLEYLIELPELVYEMMLEEETEETKEG